MAGSRCTLSSDSPGLFSSRRGRASSGAQRGSGGREGGLLTGPAGSALSPLPLSDGTNKPGSPLLPFPPRCPGSARSHPPGARGSARARQSPQEGCGPGAARAGPWEP